MNRIKVVIAFFVLVFGFIETVDAAKPVLSLAHYLQSKYLGTTISYYPKVIKKGKSTKKGEVANVVLGQDGYYFILDDETWVKVVFEVATSGDNLDANRPRFVQSKRDLQMQLLQSEEFVNATIAKVGTDTVDSIYTPVTNLSQANQLLPKSDEDFMSSEEIIYTDMRTERQKKGNVLVSPRGIVLEDGSPISIEFVSGAFGTKN